MTRIDLEPIKTRLTAADRLARALNALSPGQRWFGYGPARTEVGRALYDYAQLAGIELGWAALERRGEQDADAAIGRDVTALLISLEVEDEALILERVECGEASCVRASIARCGVTSGVTVTADSAAEALQSLLITLGLTEHDAGMGRWLK